MYPNLKTFDVMELTVAIKKPTMNWAMWTAGMCLHHSYLHAWSNSPRVVLPPVIPSAPAS